jgi:hypothetical protein
MSTGRGMVFGRILQCVGRKIGIKAPSAIAIKIKSPPLPAKLFWLWMSPRVGFIFHHAPLLGIFFFSENKLRNRQTAKMLHFFLII